MKNSQKAYIAGAIDGEGHISIVRPKEKRTDNADWDYKCNVGVSNTNINFLKHIRNISHIGSIESYRHENDKRRKNYVWIVETKDIIPFLEAIKPYLIIKDAQADLMIKFRGTYEIKYNIVPEEISSYRESLYFDCLKHNERGPHNIYYDKDPRIESVIYRNRPNILTRIEKKYIAAIIDGEGSINVNRPKNKPLNRDWPYVPHVGVINTNIDLLNYLLTITNTGLIGSRNCETNIVKNSWRWKLLMNEIIIFLEAIKPHLIIKKEQSKLMIEFMETYRIKYGRRQPVPMSVSILRELIYEELQELNKRGPLNVYYK